VTRFGDGLASASVASPDLAEATELAVGQALAPLEGRVPDLVCVFAAGPDPDAVAEAGVRVAALTGASAVVGCSARGVLGGGRGVEDGRAVSVFAAVLPDTLLRTFHLEVLPAEAGAAVVGLPERRDDDDVVLLLADPWSFPTASFVRRADQALTGLPFVGGQASGPGGAGSTRLLLDGRAQDRGAVGVVLSGGGARAVVSQGCRPVGPAMTVTAANGNVLTGLAGRPALDQVAAVVADLPPADRELAQSGLALGVVHDEYADEHDLGDYLVRSILGTQPETSGLVVGDLVAVGSTVRLQVRDARTAADDLLGRLRGVRAGGALLFSCADRGSRLFGAGGADHDVRTVQRELGADGVAGCFTGGEIGPVGGRSHLHGVTASLLAFPA
jgi:small ligand-binding sensory domain FIST